MRLGLLDTCKHLLNMNVSLLTIDNLVDSHIGICEPIGLIDMWFS